MVGRSRSSFSLSAASFGNDFVWKGSGQQLSPPESEEKEEEPKELSDGPNSENKNADRVTLVELANITKSGEFGKKYTSSKHSVSSSYAAADNAESGKCDLVLSPGEQRRSEAGSQLKNRNGFVRSQRNAEEPIEVTEIEQFESEPQ